MDNGLVLIKERRNGENFDKFETFEEFGIYCIKDNANHSLKEIGLALGYSQSAFSLRTKEHKSTNSPRLSADDIWRYMKIFKDYRPLAYLEHCVRKWEQTSEHQELSEALNFLHSAIMLITKVMGSVVKK